MSDGRALPKRPELDTGLKLGLPRCPVCCYFCFLYFLYFFLFFFIFFYFSLSFFIFFYYRPWIFIFFIFYIGLNPFAHPQLDMRLRFLCGCTRAIELALFGKF